MTTTLDIPEPILRRALTASGQLPVEQVVVQALEEYTRRRSQADMVKHLGTFRDFMTVDELDRMRSARMERHVVD